MASPQPGSDAPIREFLTGLASADSAQSAVSAAALAGAVGVSLLLRVAALPTTRSDSLDERAALLGAGAALGEVQEQLIEAIETETAVKLFAARNMPQASQIQRARRDAAIQLALRAGADVPLEVIRLCALGLKQAETVAASGSRAAASEVELAVALLRAGLTRAVEPRSATVQPDRRRVHEGGRRRNRAPERGSHDRGPRRRSIDAGSPRVTLRRRAP